ncbi:protein kinase domain-containing protein [Theileria equi strain WA]|uniref:Cyclin-dependent kinase 2 homolog n=1 Tax=Theileria equi strain WA TaxID=1537102 RepID=L0B1C7_THEEQ|nr:protein kinase domain-containing protein [Theileria equi strain WA]AFZ81635.1 protein kinase domain-containing protein [Theileria equi strain WA]|eukprot:XP_004831301.1 protein kinase domain-containing protein [Theileria equi strain WA]
MWSAACIIAEMVTGQPLFHGNSDFQVLTRIVTILGRPTEDEWKNCSLSEHYPFNGSLYQFSTESKRENLKIALKGRMDDVGLDLMMKMLEYNPHSRISAQVALSHPWFADVDYRKLDSLGVTNSLTNSMRGMFGKKIVDVMEERSKGILTTTLLSHLLHKKASMKDHIIDAIERDYTTVTHNMKCYGLPVLIRSTEPDK